jgi:hypothetical protein
MARILTHPHAEAAASVIVECFAAIDFQSLPFIFRVLLTLAALAQDFSQIRP